MVADCIVGGDDVRGVAMGVSPRLSAQVGGDVLHPSVVGASPRSAMADFILPQSFSDGAVRRVPSAAPIGRPRKSEFISPHPDVGVRLPVACILDDSTGDYYVLDPTLIPNFDDVLRRVELVPYLTRDGDVRLWPIALPGADGRLNSWPASARRIADDYGGCWVRVVANRAVGGYDAVIPCGTLRAPDWSGIDIDAIYATTAVAFGVRDVQHPLLARLLGAV